jgi:hypothetical protein
MSGTRARFLVSSPSGRRYFRDEPSNHLIQIKKIETILHRIFGGYGGTSMLFPLASALLAADTPVPQTNYTCPAGRKGLSIAL